MTFFIILYTMISTVGSLIIPAIYCDENNHKFDVFYLLEDLKIASNNQKLTFIGRYITKFYYLIALFFYLPALIFQFILWAYKKLMFRDKESEKNVKTKTDFE